ncbi:MAG: T9SS type A sorting domain-containing protein [Flavisolibacter sp.]
MKRLLLILFILLFTASGPIQAGEFVPGAGVEVQVSYLRLYPNPATTIVNLDFQKGYQRGYSLQVYNFLGRVMYEQQNIAERTTINLSQFTRGIYIYYLRDRNNQLVETGKFQVVK